MYFADLEVAQVRAGILAPEFDGVKNIQEKSQFNLGKAIVSLILCSILHIEDFTIKLIIHEKAQQTP